MKNIEIREVSGSLQLREDGGLQQTILRGTAIQFNTLSVDLGGFVETIEPQAFTQADIDASDIFVLFGHDRSKVLGRSNKGKGSLSLHWTETGINFEFICPTEDFGLREHIAMGNLTGCSFGFYVHNDEDESWSMVGDKALHTIHKMDVREISMVFCPAYETTSVSERSIEKYNDFIIRMKEDEDKKVEEEVKEEPKVEEPKEEPKAEEPKSEPAEEPKVEEPQVEEPKVEEPQVEEPKAEEPKQEEEETKEPQKEEEKEENNRSNITMQKNYSILEAIRSAVSGKTNDYVAAVSAAGREEFRSLGLSTMGQIQVPMETRDSITVSSEGDDVVVTRIEDILAPLRAENILTDAGARIYTGLSAQVQVPVMGESNCFWANEVADAQDGAGTFSHSLFSPKRLTCYIDLSKEFLILDSKGAEALIRQDMIAAILNKIEQSVLSDMAETQEHPAGILNGINREDVTSFADVVDKEGDLEQNKFKNLTYILSPKAKSKLRAMQKSSKNTQLVLENQEVDGTKALVSGYLANEYGDANYVVGDFTNLYITQFGGLDITVDDKSLAWKGLIRLTINAFFDFKMVRDGAIKYCKIN